MRMRKGESERERNDNQQNDRSTCLPARLLVCLLFASLSTEQQVYENNNTNKCSGDSNSIVATTTTVAAAAIIAETLGCNSIAKKIHARTHTECVSKRGANAKYTSFIHSFTHLLNGCK